MVGFEGESWEREGGQKKQYWGYCSVSTSNFVVTAFVIIQTAYQNAKKKASVPDIQKVDRFSRGSMPPDPLLLYNAPKGHSATLTCKKA